MKRLIIIAIIVAVTAAGLNGINSETKKKRRFSPDRTKTTASTDESQQKSALSDRINARKDSGAGLSREVKMSPTQQQNIDQLQSDLNAIKANSQVTPEQVKQLQQDLMAAVDGATKPSKQSVEKLAQDLADAWSDQKMTPKEQSQLMDDIYSVLNSANISPEQAQAVINDAKALLKSSGVSYNDIQTIMNDLQAIVNELQKNVTNIKKEFPSRKKRFRQ